MNTKINARGAGIIQNVSDAHVLKYLMPFIFLLIFTISPKILNSQILISVLFGEKLNSDKIEFGLNGGINQSYFIDVDKSKGLNTLNIGFYLDIKLAANTYLGTGVKVKSNVGASGMQVYPIDDENFDIVFEEAELTTKLGYFYIPLLLQQRFYKIVQVGVGFQAGLLNKAHDTFNMSAYSGDLEYNRNVKDDYKHLDAGLLGGVGFKLSKKPKSMSIGMNYYYGLVNVSKVANEKKKNSAFYLYVKIPIGVESADKK